MNCHVCNLPITPGQPMHDVRGVGPMHDGCHEEWLEATTEAAQSAAVDANLTVGGRWTW